MKPVLPLYTWAGLPLLTTYSSYMYKTYGTRVYRRGCIVDPVLLLHINRAALSTLHSLLCRQDYIIGPMLLLYLENFAFSTPCYSYK